MTRFREFLAWLDALSFWEVVMIMLIISICVILLEIAIAARNAPKSARERVPAGVHRDVGRVIGPDVPPAPKDRKWSNHFGSYIEMVRYTSDKDYLFKVLSGPHAGRIYHNQTAWSKLAKFSPDHAPVTKAARDRK